MSIRVRKIIVGVLIIALVFSIPISGGSSAVYGQTTDTTETAITKNNNTDKDVITSNEGIDGPSQADEKSNSTEGSNTNNPSNKSGAEKKIKSNDIKPMAVESNITVNGSTAEETDEWTNYNNFIVFKKNGEYDLRMTNPNGVCNKVRIFGLTTVTDLTINLHDMKIDNSTSVSTDGILLQANQELNINVYGNNELIGTNSQGPIHMMDSTSKLKISGDGKLKCIGTNGESAIIGASPSFGSDVNVNGITIGGSIELICEYANGSSSGACIGSAKDGNAENILITGSAVLDLKSSNGACIGSGKNGNATNITIGGSVDLKAELTSHGTCVGGGYGGNGRYINISDNSKLDLISIDGACIGGGHSSEGRNITVSDNSELNLLSRNGACIGGGISGSAEDITITDNTIVNANTYEGGACIGSGETYNGRTAYAKNLFIKENAKINAKSEWGACIGGGAGTDTSNINIEDNAVILAESNKYSPAIGGGASVNTNMKQGFASDIIIHSKGVCITGPGAGIGDGSVYSDLNNWVEDGDPYPGLKMITYNSNNSANKNVTLSYIQTPKAADKEWLQNFDSTFDFTYTPYVWSTDKTGSTVPYTSPNEDISSFSDQTTLYALRVPINNEIKILPDNNEELSIGIDEERELKIKDLGTGVADRIDWTVTGDPDNTIFEESYSENDQVLTITGKKKGKLTVTATSSANPDAKDTKVINIINEVDVITPPTTSAITYGEQISHSNIGTIYSVKHGNTEVTGTWSWHDDDEVKYPVGGTATARAIFIPDNIELESTQEILDVKVNRADLTDVVVPAIGNIYVKEPLGNDSIKATGQEVKWNGVSVKGTWSWASNNPIPQTTGSHTLILIFTPSDEEGENFKQVSKEVSVNVKSRNLIVTKPNDINLTYGAVLLQSHIQGGLVSDGAGTVTGSWDWDPKYKNTMLDAGIHTTVTAVFTPDISTGYDPVTEDIRVNVSKADFDLVSPPVSNSIYEGKKLSDAVFTGSRVEFKNTNVTGVWKYTNGENVTPPVGTNAYEAVFTPTNQKQSNFNVLKLNVDITVITRQIAVEENPLVSDITYGSIISDSVFKTQGNITHNGTPASGTWSWHDEDKNLRPDKAGEVSVRAVFKPTNTELNEETVTLRVKVNKANPLVTSDPGVGVVYAKDPLIDSSIVSTGDEVKFNGVSVIGDWSWDNSNTVPQVAGTYPMKLVFTPKGDDGDRFNPLTITINVVFKAKDLTVTKPDTINIVYSDLLTKELIKGGRVTGGNAEVRGTGDFDSSFKDKKLDAGNYTDITAVFTPEPSTGYLPVNENLNVNVAKGTLTLNSVPVADDIYYGKKLSEVLLKGGAVSFKESPVAGRWDWVQSDITPEIGTKSYDVIFTPTGDKPSNFNELKATVSLKVMTREVVFDINPTVKELTYGEQVSDSTFLDSGRVTHEGNEITGSLRWHEDDRDIMPDKSGTIQARAIFSPDNTELNDKTITIDIKVNKADLTDVKAPQVNTIYVGEPFLNSSIKPNGQEVKFKGEVVSGTFSWALDNEIPKVTGDHTFKLLFTPAGDDDKRFNPIFVNVTLNVKAKNLTITKPNVKDITYGDLLTTDLISGGNVTDGTNIIGGSWDWDPKYKNIKLDAGTYTTATALFTPNFSTGYDPLHSDLKVNVAKADFDRVTAPTADDITYGKKLSQVSLKGGRVEFLGEEVTGNWHWQDLNKIPEVGRKYYEVTFTPTSDKPSNFNEVTRNVYLNVTVESISRVTDLHATDITYGDALSKSIISGGTVHDSLGNEIEGTWDWDSSVKNRIFESGIMDYPVVFTPNDPNYESLNERITVVINKAKFTDIKLPTAKTGFIESPIDSVGFNDDGYVKLNEVVVSGKWVWDEPQDTKVEDGVSYNVRFEPYDGVYVRNYEPVTGKVTVSAVMFDSELIVTNKGPLEGYNFSGGVLHITESGTYNIELKPGIDKTAQTIKVDDNVKANIVLNEVYIDVSDIPGKAAFETGLFSDTTIELRGDNTLLSGSGRAGIDISPTLEPLKIEGSGSLTVTGGDGSAGIGGKMNQGVLGGISIAEEAVIKATGGNAGALFGAGAGIGSGGSTDRQKGAGDIEVSSLGVYAKGGEALGENGAGANMGNGGVPEADGNNIANMKVITYKSTMDNIPEVKLTYIKSVKLPGIGWLKNFEPTFDTDVYGLNWSEDPQGITASIFAAGDMYTEKREAVLYTVDEPVDDLAVIYSNTSGGYAYSGKYLNIKKDGQYIISMKQGLDKTEKAVIRVAEDVKADVQLVNVHIDVSSKNGLSAFEINKGAEVDLVSSYENILKSGTNRAGIDVKGGGKLNISNVLAGTLYIKGGAYGAGIGGSLGCNGTDISIENGTVLTAKGGINAAGIGGGGNIFGEHTGSASNITVGELGVKAEGKNTAANIGSGINDDMIVADEKAEVLSGSKSVTYDDKQSNEVTLSYTGSIKMPDFKWLKNFDQTYSDLGNTYLWSPHVDGESSDVYIPGDVYEDVVLRSDSKLYANQAPTDFDIIPTKQSVEVGESFEITPVVISGIKAAKYEVIGKEDVVDVELSEINAKITGLKKGEVKIKATSKADPKLTAICEVTVKKLSLRPGDDIDNISGDNLTYGQKLSESQINGVKIYRVDEDNVMHEMKGSWKWVDENQIPNAGQGVLCEAHFVPLDDTYEPYVKKIAIDIAKAVPKVLEHPNTSIVSQGAMLSTSEITDGKVMGVLDEQVKGSWKWNQDTSVIPSMGKSYYEAQFEPEGEFNNNYVNLTKDLPVYVPKFYKDLIITEAIRPDGTEIDMNGEKEADWYMKNSEQSIYSDILVISQSGKYNISMHPKANGKTEIGSLLIKEGVTSDITLNNVNIDLTSVPQNEERSSVSVEKNAKLNLISTGVTELRSSKTFSGIKTGDASSVNAGGSGALKIFGGDATDTKGAGAAIGLDGSNVNIFNSDIIVDAPVGINLNEGKGYSSGNTVFGKAAKIGLGSFDMNDAGEYPRLRTVTYNNNLSDDDESEINLSYTHDINLPTLSDLKKYDGGYEVNTQDLHWSDDKNALDSKSFKAGTVFDSDKDIKLYAVTKREPSIEVTDYESESENPFTFDGQTLYINEDGKYVIEMKDGDKGTNIKVADDVDVEITLNGVTLDTSERNGASPLEIGNDSNVILIVTNDNVLTAGDNKAGIEVPLSSTLKVIGKDDHSLKVKGGDYGSGIGGSLKQNAGDITIDKDTWVYSISGKDAAAIGGGGSDDTDPAGRSAKIKVPETGVALSNTGNGAALGSGANADINGVNISGYTGITYNKDDSSKLIEIAYIKKAVLLNSVMAKALTGSDAHVLSDTCWAKESTGLIDDVYPQEAKLRTNIPHTLFAVKGPKADSFELESTMFNMLVGDEEIIKLKDNPSGIVGGLDYEILTEDGDDVIDIKPIDKISAKITATYPGSVIIKVKSKVDPDNIFKTVSAVVDKKEANAVTIVPEQEAYVEINDTLTLVGEPDYPDLERSDLKWEIITKSALDEYGNPTEDTVIEKVDSTTEDFTLKGIKIGSVKVKATSINDSSITDTVTVYIMGPAPLDLKIDQIRGDHEVGYQEEIDLVTSIAAPHHQSYDVRWQITQGSSNGKLSHKIGNETTLTGIKKGTLTLTAHVKQYPKVSVTKEITVNPAVPTIIDPPTATDIEFGETLKESIISDEYVVKYKESEVKGKWSWEDDSYIPSGGDRIRELNAVFKPFDKNLSSVTVPLKVFVSGDVKASVSPIYIVFDKNDPLDTTLDLKGGTYKIKDITHNDTLLQRDRDYVLSDETDFTDTKITLSKDFLMTLKGPEQKLKFVMDGDDSDNPVLTVSIINENLPPVINETVSLNANSIPKLNTGQGYQLNAVVNPKGSNETVTWSSSNNGIASVNQNGYVKGIKEGTALIYAKLSNGHTAACTVSVVQNVTKIRTPLNTVRLSFKKSYKLPVVLDNGNQTVTSKTTFKSSNTKVATVDAKGKIKAKKKKGKATVTITTANGRTQKIKVIVSKKKKDIKKVKISGLKKKYKKGQVAFIKPKANPVNATNLKVTFKSSKKKIATVDKAGKVTVKKKGKVKITTKIGKKKFVRIIKVK